MADCDEYHPEVLPDHPAAIGTCEQGMQLCAPCLERHRRLHARPERPAL